ncbi:MAG: replicative DNA helicase [Thermoguttaceae bacterium]|jgi:replicative DNA helicase
MAETSSQATKTSLSKLTIGVDRSTPCNLDAERGVIGAILLNPNLCDDVATIVRPSDFYLDKHRRIFKALLDMQSESFGVDFTLLVERLRENNELEEIGGEAYIAELMQSVQVTAHAVYYAEIVAQNSLRRGLIDTCGSIMNDSYAPDVAAKELLNRAEQMIFALNDARSTSALTPMYDLVQDVYHLLDRRAAGQVDGVSTGFFDLDQMLGGLHGSELIILAARPSMGKTAFATNIADHVAVETQEPVLFFSLEMAKTELALRMLCARGKIASQNLRGRIADQDGKKLMKAASALGEAPLYIDDTPSRTVMEIGAVARRLKRKQGLGLIVVDYLGLIEPDNPADPRQEQVAKIARRLKGLARELNVPILCLAQLNRMAEMTKDNRPRLSHLRESGAIEQDADVVMFVHREEYYHSREDAEDKGIHGLAEIIVAKQRNGPVGDVKLHWKSEYTCFLNPPEDDGYGEISDFDDFGF